jgi:vancomycin permeability regulator SanA
MRFLRRTLLWILLIDLVFVVVYYGVTLLVDDTDSIEGGAAIVFYSGNENEANARIDKGIALLAAQKVDRLIMAGGHRPQEGITGSQDMALDAIRLYRFGEAITADVVSRDTFSAIKNAASTAEARDAKQIVFITNCMHGLRAQTVYGVVTEDGPPAHVACSRSSRNPAKIWLRAHYEAAAWGLFILPENWREGVLDKLRGSGS